MHVLLALAVTLPIQDTSADDELVKAFLGLSKEMSQRAAEEALRKRGASAIPTLVRARSKYEDQPKLFALLFELKKAERTEETQALWKTLESLKVTVIFEKCPATEVLNFLREFSERAVNLDPAAREAGEIEVTLKLPERLLWEVLDELSLRVGLDWDVRYGVIWVGKPERLWALGETPPLPRVNRWTTQEDLDPKMAEYLRGTSVTLEQSAAPLSDVVAYLREYTEKNFVLDAKDLTVDIRVKDLLLENVLALLTLPYGLDVRLHQKVVVLYDPGRRSIPLTFRTQKLEGEDEKVAVKLKETRSDLDFNGIPLKDACRFLQDFTGLMFQVDDGGDRIVTLRVMELPLWDTLALLISPCDLDARIAKGRIVVFDPAKRK